MDGVFFSMIKNDVEMACMRSATERHKPTRNM